MLAVHARYRGKALRRADLVRRSAEALATLEGVGDFEVLGVEDICAVVETGPAVCDVVMALLSDGEWAIGVGIDSALDPEDPDSEAAVRSLGTKALGKPGRATRAGVVKVAVAPTPALKASGNTAASDISATFALLGQVLAKRSIEGRQATSLVRRGLTQNEAAEELGISKQAISQRLQAAGWQAENAGWQLAVNLINWANRPEVRG
ncbi:MarR family transcriptional regulator [Corynebacterium halotolerans]|uniref:MarR family transcriptional regulator n=1 Tax=Corynebacterium halotolerans TaxID=225326 RepID=UPI003CEE87A4